MGTLLLLGVGDGLGGSIPTNGILYMDSTPMGWMDTTQGTWM